MQEHKRSKNFQVEVSLNPKVRGLVRTLTGNQVEHRVRGQFWNQTRIQVWNQVNHQVWDRVGDQVRNQAVRG